MKKIYLILIFISFMLLLKQKVTIVNASFDVVIQNFFNEYFDETYTLLNQEILYDFDDNEYLLVTTYPKGYMIIEDEEDFIVEYSNETINPYNEYLEYEKYYLGPKNYIVKDTNTSIYYDCLTGNSILIGSAHNELSSTIKTNIINEVNANYTYSLPRTTTSDNTVIDSKGYTVIQDHEYFRKLEQFPENDDNTCGFTSLSMLLGYFDTFKNPYTIPDKPSTGDTEDEWMVKSDKEAISSFSLLTSSNLYSLFNKHPGTKKSLSETLIGYGHYWFDNVIGTPIGGNGLHDTFTDYKEDYIDNYKDYYTSEYRMGDMFNTVTNSVKEQINLGNPSIVTFYYAEYNAGVDDWTYMHNVIIYGYKNKMYLAHFGWINSYEVYVSSIFFNSLFYINYSGPHIHGENYRWECNGSTGVFCPCGEIECYHENSYYTYEQSNDYHILNCNTCGESIISSHNLEIQNGQYVCSICNYVGNECIHEYVYSGTYSRFGHNVKCSICNATTQVSHNFIDVKGKKYCTVCPYSSNVVVILNKEGETI